MTAKQNIHFLMSPRVKYFLKQNNLPMQKLYIKNFRNEIVVRIQKIKINKKMCVQLCQKESFVLIDIKHVLHKIDRICSGKIKVFDLMQPQDAINMHK